MTEAVLPDAHVTRGPRAENHRLVREKKNKYRISPSHAWSHLAEQRHNDTNTVCHRMESDEASCGLLLDKKASAFLQVSVELHLVKIPAIPEIPQNQQNSETY